MPRSTDFQQNCIDIDVPGIITCAQLSIEIDRFYDLTGVEFSIFQLISTSTLKQHSVNELRVIIMNQNESSEHTYIGWHHSFRRTSTSVVRCQVVRTSIVIGDTGESAGCAIIMAVDLIVRTVYITQRSTSTLRFDSTLPGRIMTDTRYTQVT